MPTDNLVQLGSLSPIFEIDPVCKMRVMPETAVAKYDFEGKTYYFCARRCQERFAADPRSFLTAAPQSAIRISQSAIYTCPMHPEVRQNGPGSWPKCGMALEPEMATEETEENPELKDMTRRFWIAAVFSVPVLILGMLERLPQLQFLLATPAVLWAGWPLFERAWASVVHRSPNMFTLIGMGTGVAYLYSVIAVLFPGIFPGPPPVYFEAASVITALVLLGQVLELRA